MGNIIPAITSSHNKISPFLLRSKLTSGGAVYLFSVPIPVPSPPVKGLVGPVRNTWHFCADRRLIHLKFDLKVVESLSFVRG